MAGSRRKHGGGGRRRDAAPEGEVLAPEPGQESGRFLQAPARQVRFPLPSLPDRARGTRAEVLLGGDVRRDERWTTIEPGVVGARVGGCGEQ